MTISKADSIDPIYAKHSSQKLIQAFKGHQGQAPEDAQFIFLGLDANFAADIEESPVFEEVIEYLTDGVGYWIRRNRHHPFLSPAYQKRSGYKYHNEFSKLGLTAEYAEKISFVELLNCPTCGNTIYKRLIEMLDVSHLRKLDHLMLSPGGNKAVYITKGVYSKLFDIGQEYRCFQWLPRPIKFERNTLYPISEFGGTKIYVITHFSDAISKKHLADIRRTIKM